MSPQTRKLTMTPHTGKIQRRTNSKGVHQTPIDTTTWPDHTNAVWRMARLESRRRARQAAIPPRVSASSLRSEDTRMRLLNDREAVAPNGAGTPRTEAS